VSGARRGSACRAVSFSTSLALRSSPSLDGEETAMATGTAFAVAIATCVLISPAVKAWNLFELRSGLSLEEAHQTLAFYNLHITASGNNIYSVWDRNNNLVYSIEFCRNRLFSVNWHIPDMQEDFTRAFEILIHKSSRFSISVQRTNTRHGEIEIVNFVGDNQNTNISITVSRVARQKPSMVFYLSDRSIC
jgi:hypothetical protein